MEQRKGHTAIRMVTYEYTGSDRDIDLFLESAIRDFYGNRLASRTENDPGFIDKVESDFLSQ